MPAISYNFVSRCSGGAHVTMDISVDGGAARRVTWDIDEIREAFSRRTPQELEKLALDILATRFHGLSRAQIVNAFQAGAGTVTVQVG